MPNLQTVRRWDSEEDPAAYDLTSLLFRDQADTVVELKRALRMPPPDMDLTRHRLWELERSFSENALNSLGLLHPGAITKHLHVAEITEYAAQSMSTCLALLVFAVGAATMDSAVYAESSKQLPGFAYYSRATAIHDALSMPESNLEVLQARVLTGTYFLYSLRPFLAWKEFSMASQECVILLKMTRLSDETAEFRDIFSRIFWVCYALGHELEVCFELPPSGLRQYDTVVPLPVSDFEEQGLYYILAKASLRKLMMEVADTVGLTSQSGAPYAPLVILELRKQVDGWYQHLPGSLRFPIDQSRLFDSRRSHLRCQYYSLIAVVTWPFLVEGASLCGDRPENDDYSRKGAQECLRACRAYIQSAEEILTQKSLESHLVMRGYFAMTMVLIIALPLTPDDSEDLSYRRLLGHAFHSLSYWKMVPFMRRPLMEMERIARLKGVPITK